MQRYKDLLSLREKEIETLKTEMRRIQKSNEDLRKHCESIEKELKGMGLNMGSDSKKQGTGMMGGIGSGNKSHLGSALDITGYN